MNQWGLSKEEFAVASSARQSSLDEYRSPAMINYTYAGLLASVLSRSVGTSSRTARHQPSGIGFEHESGSTYYTCDGATFTVRDDEGNRYFVKIDACTLSHRCAS